MEKISSFEVKNLDEIEAFLWGNNLKILYISSPNCATCHALFPKIASIANKHYFVDFCKADISVVPAIGARFGIFSAPTILILHNNKEYARFDRYTRIEIFEEKINTLRILTEEKSLY